VYTSSPRLCAHASCSFSPVISCFSARFVVGCPVQSSLLTTQLKSRASIICSWGRWSKRGISWLYKASFSCFYSVPAGAYMLFIVMPLNCPDIPLPVGMFRMVAN
jgi:hypothetical protein